MRLTGDWRHSQDKKNCCGNIKVFIKGIQQDTMWTFASQAKGTWCY